MINCTLKKIPNTNYIVLCEKSSSYAYVYDYHQGTNNNNWSIEFIPVTN